MKHQSTTEVCIKKKINVSEKTEAVEIEATEGTVLLAGDSLAATSNAFTAGAAAAGVVAGAVAAGAAIGDAID